MKITETGLRASAAKLLALVACWGAFAAIAAAERSAPGVSGTAGAGVPGMSSEASGGGASEANASGGGASGGVSEGRFARLARGINTSHWLAQVYAPQGYTAAHFEKHTTAADIDLIADLELTHVRLSVEPKPLFNPERPAELPDDYLVHLDRAIEMILNRDLAVIVDIHGFGPFIAKLNDDDAHVEAVAAFWRALASHLSKYDPNRLFLELLNEPQVRSAERWRQVATTLAAAARAGAPHHTLIVSGHAWSGIDELLAMQPLDDPNIVYNFHFYDPHLFTHQGATWGWHTWKHVKHVPYPSTPENVAPLLATIEREAARAELRRYGEQRWDAAKIESRIAQIGEWAREHNVRVTCNEFGVYTAFADPDDRAAWIRDVRQALERHDIGWTMWDYAGGFALVTKEDGRPEPIPAVVSALGLNGSRHR